MPSFKYSEVPRDGNALNCLARAYSVPRVFVALKKSTEGKGKKRECLFLSHTFLDFPPLYANIANTEYPLHLCFTSSLKHLTQSSFRIDKLVWCWICHSFFN